MDAEAIGDEAFAGCDNLEKITIPYTVTFIGERAIPSHTVIYCYYNSNADLWANANGNYVVYLGISPVAPASTTSSNPTAGTRN